MIARDMAVDGLRNLLVWPPDASDDARYAELARVLVEDDAWYARLEAAYEGACAVSDAGGDGDAIVDSLWGTACQQMAAYQELRDEARKQPRGRFRRQFLAAVTERMDRLAELMRTMVVVWDDLDLDTPDAIRASVWTFRITPAAYLRAMGNLLWSAIRHPRSETTIELKTGRVLYRS